VVWIDVCLGLSITGAGCGLICVGAGEEQARKVYAKVASEVMERQVGLVRGTRWPTGSSAGRMVQERARQRGHVVKPVVWWQSSQGMRQDRVDHPGAAGERLGMLEAWRGGCAVHVGFGCLATKPSGGGFLGLGIKTKSEDQAWWHRSVRWDRSDRSGGPV
jgi:hypothetical protein